MSATTATNQAHGPPNCAIPSMPQKLHGPNSVSEGTANAAYGRPALVRRTEWYYFFYLGQRDVGHPWQDANNATMPLRKQPPKCVRRNGLCLVLSHLVHSMAHNGQTRALMGGATLSHSWRAPTNNAWPTQPLSCPPPIRGGFPTNVVASI